MAAETCPECGHDLDKHDDRCIHVVAVQYLGLKETKKCGCTYWIRQEKLKAVA